MQATAKQISYLKSLLAEAGFLNPRFDSLSGGAKRLPNGPTMRQRSGRASDWLASLTVGQAAELIDHLKDRR